MNAASITTITICLSAILMMMAPVASASTIVTFGDSTTARREGVIVYSTLLENDLPALGVNATVINKGIGGNNTNDGIERFNYDVLGKNPDVVVIQFGINDSMVDVWKNPPATASRVPLSTYRANLTYMTQTLKNAGANVILMTPNPMRWSSVWLHYYGAAPYDTTDVDGLNATIKDYVQAVRQIAAAEQVDLVDVYDMFVQYDQIPGQEMMDLSVGGMHPNSAGHRLIANELEAIIIPTPEPTTCGLLAASGLGLLRRRRQQ